MKEKIDVEKSMRGTWTSNKKHDLIVKQRGHVGNWLSHYRASSPYILYICVQHFMNAIFSVLATGDTMACLSYEELHHTCPQYKQGA